MKIYYDMVSEGAYGALKVSVVVNKHGDGVGNRLS